MKLVDANVLIYAVNSDAPLHAETKTWLELTLSGSVLMGLSWTVILAFLRLTTKAGVFEHPLDARTALGIVEGWLGQPTVVIVEPTERHLQILRGLLVGAGTGGNITSDAHLAALAIEHGGELCTFDGDFARFPNLRWCNPLA